MQAFWFASMEFSDLAGGSLTKSLQADAGSGVIFNFRGEITIGGETLREGVVMLPVSSEADSILLQRGARLAGIRFHPAMGFGVLGRHYIKPTLLPLDDQNYGSLYQLYECLSSLVDDTDVLDFMCFWVAGNLHRGVGLPPTLKQAISLIDQGESIASLYSISRLSQRQLERQFKLWLGMTPKSYQRIQRVRKVISFLRLNKDAELTDTALQFGFSDQAHMTRELQVMARTTPRQV